MGDRWYMKTRSQGSVMPLDDNEPTKKIYCDCGKLLARRTRDGKILVWCKSCHKEVELEVEPYEPERNPVQSKKVGQW